MNYPEPLPLIAFTVGLKDQNFTIGDNKDTPDTVLFDYEALVCEYNFVPPIILFRTKIHLAVVHFQCKKDVLLHLFRVKYFHKFLQTI